MVRTIAHAPAEHGGLARGVDRRQRGERLGVDRPVAGRRGEREVISGRNRFEQSGGRIEVQAAPGQRRPGVRGASAAAKRLESWRLKLLRRRRQKRPQTTRSTSDALTPSRQPR